MALFDDFACIMPITTVQHIRRLAPSLCVTYTNNPHDIPHILLSKMPMHLHCCMTLLAWCAAQTRPLLATCTCTSHTHDMHIHYYHTCIVAELTLANSSSSSCMGRPMASIRLCSQQHQAGIRSIFQVQQWQRGYQVNGPDRHGTLLGGCFESFLVI